MSIEPKACPLCNGKATLVQWKDTLKPNATWIECEECGCTTTTLYSKNAETAKNKVLNIWNTRTENRIKGRKGLLSCPCCGSKNQSIKNNKLKCYGDSFFITCDCGLIADVLVENSEPATVVQAKEFWNRKII